MKTSSIRYISVGLVILALGAFIWTIPHFTTLTYNPGEEGGESLSEYLYIFILVQLLVGFGYSPLETLGIAYIDDNVDSSTSSVYIAIVQTGIVLGPAAGFVLEIFLSGAEGLRRSPSCFYQSDLQKIFGLTLMLFC